MLINEQLAESDFAAQARVHAAQLGQNLQVGARDAADRFNRFVEGEGGTGAGGAQRRAQPERQDFWDDFSAVGEQAARQKRQSGAIGTAAMRNTPTSTTAAAGARVGAMAPAATGVGANTATSGTAKEKEDWGEDW